MLAFGTTFVHLILFQFKEHFKLVVFLGIRTGTSCAGSGWPGSESWVRGESLMRRWGDGAPPYSRATPCLWDVMDRDSTLSLGREP